MLNAYFILGLIKVKAKINHHRHPFFYILISIFKQFVEDDIFSPVYILYLFVKNQVAVAVWAYICVLYPIDLRVYFCIIPYRFYYYNSVILLVISQDITSCNILFDQELLGNVGSFVFMYKF